MHRVWKVQKRERVEKRYNREEIEHRRDRVEKSESREEIEQRIGRSRYIDRVCAEHEMSLRRG